MGRMGTLWADGGLEVVVYSVAISGCRHENWVHMGFRGERFWRVPTMGVRKKHV